MFPVTTGRYCDICDYDICELCVASGRWCHERSHNLPDRPVVDLYKELSGLVERLQWGRTIPEVERTAAVDVARNYNGPFRLLTVHPLSKTDTEVDRMFGLITCNIEEVVFDKPPFKTPDYHVAIYQPRWSHDLTPDHMIICNGKELRVTFETYVMLQLFRKLEPHKIWFDKLCLNENERPSTAGFRLDVYRKASAILSVFNPDVERPSSRSRSPNPQYVYEPLQRPDEIRLFRVVSSSPENLNLEISMEIVSLSSTPEYTKLHMGVPIYGPATAIRCHGQTIYRPRNLVSILSHTKMPRQSNLFLDSLCVQGDDAAELAHHDVLSTRISQQAKQLLNVEGFKYSHFRLDNPGKWIRLLKLIANTKNWIIAEMITTSLENAPRYVALSYCWGNPDRRRGLTLEKDGSFLEITQSLHLALSELLDQGYE
ncbi:hypothetical protein H2203_008995 [Taxawa tesnikishii (nom. ined.)]|nr:hypothetical protein H2203_008995 [Dothideales sp. JES 119]